MTDTERLQQIHDFTANYFFWQGLRWVPLGFALLLLAFEPGRLLPFGEGSELVASAILFALALTISNSIGRWYRRRFGAVRGTRDLHTRRDLLKWTVFYPMIGLAMILDGVWRPPILLSGPVWAVSLAAYWASTGRGRNHYIIIAGAFAVSTFFPLFGEPASGGQRLNFLLALIGMAYIVGGVLDHFALLRMLRGTEAGDARTV